MSKIPMLSKVHLTDYMTHVNLKYCDWTATIRIS